MAVRFHPLNVQKIHRETADCIVITFDIPEALQEHFQYCHGQNITLRKMIDGEEVRRSYSICSAPFENKLSVAVKKIDAGKFSTYVNAYLQTGDLLDVLPPTGKFTLPLHYSHKKNYLAFAAGSGITPVISIIKTTLSTEPGSSFTLVYGNRTRSSIIFFEELEGLKNRYTGRFNFINILSREKTDAAIHSGRINAEKLVALKKIILYEKMDEIFICGPQEMLFSVKEFLTQLGIEQKKIHFELFATADSKTSIVRTPSQTGTTAINSQVSIRLDGRSFEFELPFDSESILDAALCRGADLPYACRGGMCCTCRAKLLSGEVKMEVNYALGEEELAAGFILTCQSRPLTQKVTIDFDSR